MIELDSLEIPPEYFDNSKAKYMFVEQHAKEKTLAEVLTKVMWLLKVKIKNNEIEIDLTDYEEEESKQNSYGW